ncbi:MAG: class I SAM-dependent methyltransferase [Candidatus Electrothrix sp. Rat3]|nr:class I SAM-dependent methyltransferase [Candidatus Electrothrix rattekaaiensis]
MYEEYIIQDSDKLRRIEDALLATYFKNYDQEFLTTETGKEDIKANVYRRYNKALKHVVPWTAKQIDLRDKTLVEIGSGTGSSAAAFAHFVKKIDGYDIDEQALSGARVRMEVMEFDNVALHLVAPQHLVGTLKENHADGVDIILLFAVLEHQTIQERHETIKLCWELLNPDGILVVTETPNLLQYTDTHTSLLPFQHLLPTELYARYADRSPREGFGNCFTDAASLSCQDLDTSIMRWGRGASYHDFELALGKDHGKYLVANGFEQEILSWVDVSLEEELLRYFFEAKCLDVPLAFSRIVLNLIYKKSEIPSACLPPAPEQIFIIDKYLYREQELVINSLNERLAAAEKQLHDILASKRWLLGNILAAPYRKMKALFSDSAT